MSDQLVRQLLGRAQFLEDRGEVKSPSLMREAAACLAQAIDARSGQTEGLDPKGESAVA